MTAAADAGLRQSASCQLCGSFEYTAPSETFRLPASETETDPRACLVMSLITCVFLSILPDEKPGENKWKDVKMVVLICLIMVCPYSSGVNNEATKVLGHGVIQPRIEARTFRIIYRVGFS